MGFFNWRKKEVVLGEHTPEQLKALAKQAREAEYSTVPADVQKSVQRAISLAYHAAARGYTACFVDLDYSNERTLDEVYARVKKELQNRGYGVHAAPYGRLAVTESRTRIQVSWA